MTTIQPPSPGAKAGAESVRRHNLGLVLRAVLEEGEVTRARVAARVGLTRAAVSSLVEELLSLGHLTESGKTFSGSAGRPGTVLKVSETGPAGLGVEINIDYVSVCAAGLTGTDRVRVTEHIDNRNTPPAEVLAHAARLTNRVITSTGEQGLRAVGVELALPGLVSGGMVRQAPNLGWYRVAAEGIFGQALSTLRPHGPGAGGQFRQRGQSGGAGGAVVRRPRRRPQFPLPHGRDRRRRCAGAAG